MGDDQIFSVGYDQFIRLQDDDSEFQLLIYRKYPDKDGEVDETETDTFEVPISEDKREALSQYFLELSQALLRDK